MTIAVVTIEIITAEAAETRNRTGTQIGDVRRTAGDTSKARSLGWEPTVTLWNGLLAPAKTPPEIVEKIYLAARDALRSDALKAKLAEQGSEPVGNTPVEFRSFIGSELVKWRKLVEISGATVQ